VVRHFRHRDAHACHNFLQWFEDADGIRISVSRLVNSEPGDIAFVTNAASALSILMSGLDWKPGDRIVTLAGEFPNNIYNPAVLTRFGVEFDEVEWESFYDSITPSTRLVVLSTVNYTSGFRPPLKEIAVYLKERGVLFCVDGTQSVGALRFDIADIQPDVLAVDAYKWLLGPTGSGFAFIEPNLRQRLHPTVVGWRSHKDWRNVDNLHHGTPEFSSDAERFEGGMLTFPSVYGMGASVEWMLEIGPAEIETRVMELAGKVREALRGLGARLLCDEAPHYDSPIVAARFDGVDSIRLAGELKSRDVLVSARHGNLRVSTHFYNNEEDIATLERETRSLI